MSPSENRQKLRIQLGTRGTRTTGASDRGHCPGIRHLKRASLCCDVRPFHDAKTLQAHTKHESILRRSQRQRDHWLMGDALVRNCADYLDYSGVMDQFTAIDLLTLRHDWVLRCLKGTV